jgi:hypothetical protein
MTHPAEIAAEIGFRTDEALKFCEGLLTEVNMHTAAGLLLALRLEDYESAHRLIDIQDAMENGPMFGPEAEKIAADRRAVLKRLEVAAESRRGA